MLSIRGKLVLMLVSALVTAGVVASVATYYSTRMEFSSLFDAQLKHTALELIEGGNIEVNSVALIGQAPQQQISVQVYDAADNRLYVARSQHPLPVAEIPSFSTFTDEAGQSCILVLRTQEKETYLVEKLPVTTGLDDDLDIAVSGTGVEEGLRVITDAKSYLSYIGKTVTLAQATGLEDMMAQMEAYQ